MFLINLIYLLVALVAVFATLRVVDWFAGEKFRDNLPIIKSDPVGFAVYRAAWVLGVCYVAGKLLGV